jgi:hypothetical protein
MALVGKLVGVLEMLPAHGEPLAVILTLDQMRSGGVRAPARWNRPYL